MRMSDLGIVKKYVTRDGSSFNTGGGAVRYLARKNREERNRRKLERVSRINLEQKEVLRKYLLQINDKNTSVVIFIDALISIRFELKNILKAMKPITIRNTHGGIYQ